LILITGRKLLISNVLVSARKTIFQLIVIFTVSGKAFMQKGKSGRRKF